MKKILLIIISIISILGLVKVNTKTYGTDESIIIESETFDYVINREFRAVWVSAYVNDVASFQNETQYKNEINKVFNTMEKYNLNVMIFHVRIMNDAFYSSEMNNWSRFYNYNPSWDALSWIIEECHNRGIEFHAWMNPYRVSTSTGSSLTSIARNFPNNNPASSPSNLLVGNGTVILNPGIPAVQSFLVSTCMELIKKYDIDAIHFDDYFYVDGMSSDSDTYASYGEGQGIEQFRRDSVDKFISMLSARIKDYNLSNHKSVQLGISPTPIWNNGDGVVNYDEEGNAITTGSKTSGEGHYGKYLYCDTLNWINNEWIDYIIPQCYYGLSSELDTFYREVEWWDKVVKNKPCKLYIGIGIYRANSYVDWDDSNELKNEFDYMSKFENIDGYAYFSLKSTNQSGNIKLNMESVRSYYEDISIGPVVERFKDEVINVPTNAYIINNGSSHTIAFEKDSNAMFYIILKEVNGKVSLLTKINSSTNKISYNDVEENDANYYVALVNRANQISDYVKLSTKDTYYVYSFYNENNELIKEIASQTQDFEFPEFSNLDKEGYEYSWTHDGNNYYLEYTKLLVNVYYYLDNRLFKTISVEYGDIAPDIEVNLEYKEFLGWENLEEVYEDTRIYGYTIDIEVPLYNVSFYINDKVVKTITLRENETYVIDYNYEKTGYDFLGWYLDGELINEIVVTKDISLIGLIEKIVTVYHINYDLDGGKCEDLVYEYTDPTSVTLPTPTKEGYKFLGWYSGEKKVKNVGYKDYDLTAKWEKIEIIEPTIEPTPINNGCKNYLMCLYTIFSLVGILLFRRRK